MFNPATDFIIRLMADNGCTTKMIALKIEWTIRETMAYCKHHQIEINPTIPDSRAERIRRAMLGVKYENEEGVR